MRILVDVEDLKTVISMSECGDSEEVQRILRAILKENGVDVE